MLKLSILEIFHTKLDKFDIKNKPNELYRSSHLWKIFFP